MARTGKSLLLEGRFRGARAVAKVLTDQGEFWRSRLHNELAFYKAARSAGAPVAIPHLFCGDDDLGVLILEYLEGRPLASTRYPDTPVDERDFALLLRALTDLHAWKPTPAPFRATIAEAMARRMEKHVGRGVLPERDAIHAVSLMRAASWEPVFSHRDLLFTNCLVRHDRVALIDWEYAGYALPGYDEALLWVLLMDDASKRNRVIDVASAHGEERALLFTINVMSLLAREVHQLRASGDEDLRRRATTLETDLTEVRTWIRPR